MGPAVCGVGLWRSSLQACRHLCRSFMSVWAEKSVSYLLATKKSNAQPDWHDLCSFLNGARKRKIRDTHQSDNWEGQVRILRRQARLKIKPQIGRSGRTWLSPTPSLQAGRDGAIFSPGSVRQKKSMAGRTFSPPLMIYDRFSPPAAFPQGAWDYTDSAWSWPPVHN